MNVRRKKKRDERDWLSRNFEIGAPKCLNNGY